MVFPTLCASDAFSSSLSLPETRVTRTVSGTGLGASVVVDPVEVDGDGDLDVEGAGEPDGWPPEQAPVAASVTAHSSAPNGRPNCLLSTRLPSVLTPDP